MCELPYNICFVYLCFTHIAARSLALAGKIQSTRKLDFKRSCFLYEARKALKCTAKMVSFAHSE